jgi:hypothetical protein
MEFVLFDGTGRPVTGQVTGQHETGPRCVTALHQRVLSRLEALLSLRGKTRLQKWLPPVERSHFVFCKLRATRHERRSRAEGESGLS